MKAQDDQAYTFTSHSGREVTVTADNEAEARDLAMRQLWHGVGLGLVDSYGLPILCPPYVGYGLALKPSTVKD